MFRNLVLSAAGAAVVVCLAIGLLQAFTTGPLILHAEVFEKAGEATAVAEAVPDDHQQAVAHDHATAAWEPSDGFERAAYTFLADLMVGLAVSLILLGAMLAKGDPIDAPRGLLFGVAGFVAASLLPSLGLPPELPGTPSADLLSRQIWWLGTAAASGIGLWLIAYGGWPLRVLGLALLVAPHAIGAPAPPSHEAAYPAGMAGEFVIASVVVSAALWSLSGLASGWLYARLSRRA